MISFLAGRKKAIGLSLALGLLSVVGLLVFTPLPKSIEKELQGTLTLHDCQSRPIVQLAGDTARLQVPIKLQAMGSNFPDVMVRLEDHRFHQHDGIDFSSLSGSIVRNLKHGRIISGGSTITQQLIKAETNRYKRSVPAKLYEMAAALKIERKWSKQQILERYLNQISFSNRLIGIEAAANVYFGKSTAELDLNESVFLAGLPQSPTRYNPWRRKENAANRYQRSIDRLLESGYLSPEQASDLENHPPKAQRYLEPRKAPHYVDVIKKRYPEKQGVVTTSLDLSLQKIAEQSVAAILHELREHRARNVSVIVMDNETGMIRAMVGSGDWNGPAGQINGTLIRRGAGSTLKPFLYAMAFENRKATPATLFPDTPDAISKIYPDYSPRNFDLRFWGPVRAREALGCSMNVPAVIVIHDVGLISAYNRLQKLGFGFREEYYHYGAGLALGNAEIRLLDLVEAFSLFAREGKSIKARFLPQDPIEEVQQFPDDVTALICDILSDNRARSRTFGVDSPLAFEGFQIPCKTGTSSSFRDNWTVGSTQQHTVGVWMGNFSGETMKGISSVNGSSVVFQSIVKDLLASGDTGVHSKPSHYPNLTQVEICSLTGLLPGKHSRDRLKEWFIEGTEPTQNANKMIKSASEEEIDLVLPKEYAVWCESPHNWLNATIDRSNNPVRITSPLDGDTFHVVNYIPEDQQMIMLKGTGGDKEHYTWFIDGEKIEPKNDFFMWKLEIGKHEVLLQSDSEKHSVSFQVVEDSDG